MNKQMDNEEWWGGVNRCRHGTIFRIFEQTIELCHQRQIVIAIHPVGSPISAATWFRDVGACICIAAVDVNGTVGGGLRPIRVYLHRGDECRTSRGLLWELSSGG